MVGMFEVGHHIKKSHVKLAIVQYLYREWLQNGRRKVPVSSTWHLKALHENHRILRMAVGMDKVLLHKYEERLHPDLFPEQ